MTHARGVDIWVSNSATCECGRCKKRAIKQPPTGSASAARRILLYTVRMLGHAGAGAVRCSKEGNAPQHAHMGNSQIGPPLLPATCRCQQRPRLVSSEGVRAGTCSFRSWQGGSVLFWEGEGHVAHGDDLLQRHHAPS
jgi:hypothetical protein